MRPCAKATPAYRIPALLVLLLLTACSIEDPSGTWWDTPFFLSAQPETLKVSRAGNGPQVDFTGEDSLILFLQELDPVVFPIGDSLRWSGLLANRSAGLDSLVLDSLGSTGVSVPLTLAFPDLAPLVGGQHQVTERLTFLLDLPLPAFESYDWIRFLHGRMRLGGQHAWPFALESLQYQLLAGPESVLAEGVLETQVFFPSDITVFDQPALEGVAPASLVLRISGRSLPMSTPAQISNSALELELFLDGGSAAAARAQLPDQLFLQQETVFTDSSLRIGEAHSRDQDLVLLFHNPLSVPLHLEVAYPEITRLDTGDTLRIPSGELPPGGSRQVRLDNLELRIHPLPDTPDHSLVVRITGRTVSDGDLQTLDTAQRPGLELLLAPAALDYFRGEFSRDHPVGVENSRHQVEDFPPELRDMVLRHLELHMVLANPLQVDFAVDLEMDVTSASGRPDTTFQVQGLAEGNRDRVILPGMGVFLERIPDQLEFNGNLLILKDHPVELWHDSEIVLERMEVPGHLRVVDALWRSVPELNEADLPREVLSADAVLTIENTIPLGGTLEAWIGSGDASPGDTSGAVRALPAITLAGATGLGGLPGVHHDTLRVPLTEEALGFLRGGHWESGRFVPRAGDTGDWWGWYQFRATSGPDTVAVRRDQELRVLGRIEVRMRLGAE
jgi:hypothetical protein